METILERRGRHAPFELLLRLMSGEIDRGELDWDAKWDREWFSKQWDELSEGTRDAITELLLMEVETSADMWERHVLDRKLRKHRAYAGALPVDLDFVPEPTAWDLTNERKDEAKRGEWLSLSADERRVQLELLTREMFGPWQRRADVVLIAVGARGVIGRFNLRLKERCVELAARVRSGAPLVQTTRV